MLGDTSSAPQYAFIIEDEYLIGQSLRDMLEKLGFTRFSFARSEDAAVMGATAQSIDLITADVRLLPGDGVRAVDAICEKRAIPVVFITGYADSCKIGYRLRSWCRSRFRRVSSLPPSVTY